MSHNVPRDGPAESDAEKRSPAALAQTLTTQAPAPTSRLRSCLICRSRKVRCDKQLPCSNCRRGNVTCVYPPNERPPRWTRRFLGAGVASSSTTAAFVPTADESIISSQEIVDKIRDLESLVENLQGQLKQTHIVADLTTASSAGAVERMGPSAAEITSLQAQFSLLAQDDSHRSRSMYRNFWSLVSDELRGLGMDDPSALSDDDRDSSDQISSSSEESVSAEPSLFRRHLGPSIYNVHDLLPSSSQIPVILHIFSENINIFIQAVHMPTINRILKGSRDDMARLCFPNTALFFAICYATVVCMEEEKVLAVFKASRSDLAHKYRLGLEYALTEAAFLTAPELTHVQTLVIFLSLARRIEHPKFIWIMLGTVIRMAQSIGLHRDGDHFPRMSPYEKEMRRRIWWLLCGLDMRASEDQRTLPGISTGSFDTKIPLNIKDSDIEIDTPEMPPEQSGITEMSYALLAIGLCSMTSQIIAPGMSDGTIGLKEKCHILEEIYRKFEKGHGRYLDGATGAISWFAITTVRVVMAKFTLAVFLPVLFSAPGEEFSYDIRTKLLLSAIEVAEDNHALNSEPDYSRWHWVCQTYTHWHAIVYLLLEISRRPWSPIAERAWIALHSQWLIPVHARKEGQNSIWSPLRTLMVKARKHRQAELARLRLDPQAANDLEEEDWKFPMAFQSEPLPTQPSVSMISQRWRQLVGPASTITSLVNPESTVSPSASDNVEEVSLGRSVDPTFSRQMSSQTGNNKDHHEQNQDPHFAETTLLPTAFGSSYGVPITADGRSMGPGSVAWLWADTDESIDVFSTMDIDMLPETDMDLDTDMDWHNWIEFAGEYNEADNSER